MPESLPSNLSPKQTLINARALIADRAHWTQEAYARSADGSGLQPLDERATCYCSLGALYKAANHYPIGADSVPGIDELRQAAHEVWDERRGTDCGGSVPEVNDDLGHEAALRMFDRAIAIADAAIGAEA